MNISLGLKEKPEDELTVLYTRDNGQTELVTANLTGKTVTFANDSFSEYVIASNPSTEEELNNLKTQIASGQDIKLDADVTIPENFSYQFVGVSVTDKSTYVKTIDLNDHTLTINNGGLHLSLMRALRS